MARVSNLTIHNYNRFGKKLDNEQMIRQFKKKMEKSDLLSDLRKHEFYLKPSIKKKLKSKMARMRVEKDLRKKAKYVADKADK